MLRTTVFSPTTKRRSSNSRRRRQVLVLEVAAVVVVVNKSLIHVNRQSKTKQNSEEQLCKMLEVFFELVKKTNTKTSMIFRWVCLVLLLLLVLDCLVRCSPSSWVHHNCVCRCFHRQASGCIVVSFDLQRPCLTLTFERAHTTSSKSSNDAAAANR